MPKYNDVNINMLTQQFLSNAGGYVKASTIPDSYKSWQTPDALNNVRIESDITFLKDLTVMYEKVGPTEWKGQTVPTFVPVDTEVGDDHLSVTDAPLLFVAELITANDVFGVQVSEKDTFISDRYGNYSESYILKPDNISELYHPSMSSGEDLVYLDIAKIRTVIPVCSMRQKHSDTVDGKVSLLGKQAIYKTGLCGYEITIAQCLQQLCLGLNKELKFPYIPTYLGGFGSPPIFDNPKSMIRCFQTYRNGVYYNLLSAISLAVFNTKTMGRDSSKKFLTHVKGQAESWQDWYKVYTKFTPTIKGDLNPKYYSDEYLIGTLGKNEVWDSAANRLLSAGYVCSKTQLLVHDHLEDLTRVLLSPYCSLETRVIIELEKRRQRQESVFNTHLRNEVDFEIPLFLEDNLVDSLLDLSRKSNYHLKAMLSSEVIFKRHALDEIKQCSPTIVSMQMSTKKGLRLPLRFDLDIRDDEIQYYESLYDYVLGNASLNEVSRVLIEDDPVLIQIAREWAIETSGVPLSTIKVMVITTDDVAMCRSINGIVPQIVVISISPRRNDQAIKNIKDSLVATFKFADLRFYDDEGSIAHAKASTAFKSTKAGWQKVKFVLGRAIKPDKTTHRRLNEVRVVDLILKPDGIFDQQGLLSGRYNVPRVSFKRTLSKFGMEEEYSQLGYEEF